jgi:hypothetical protein
LVVKAGCGRSFKEDLEMKVVLTIAVVITALTSIPVAAQQDDETAPAGDQAKVTYASTRGGFGDLASSHAYEMTPVVCELQGKLDSTLAKVGDRVVLKTSEKVLTADGTLIPSGARLIGHVTEVNTYDPDRGPGLVAIAFDHAELKNGQSIAIYTLIRGATPVGARGTDQISDRSMMGMPVPLGPGVNGGRMSPDYSGAASVDEGGSAPGQVDRVSDPDGRESNRRDTKPESTDDAAVQPSSGANTDTGAHAFAAARAVPRPTGIRGVMLAGNSSSSGVLTAPAKDIQLDSGTHIQMGVVDARKEQ